jgi:dCMP deaminase
VRPSKDEYFLAIARAVSTRGTCSRRQVGAIAVRDGRILATGYNGSPPGAVHCHHEDYEVHFEDQDLHLVAGRWSCSRAVHAEMNVIAYAARYGASLEGATIYCNTYPCYGCAKAMVSAGVVEVLFESDYVNDPLVTQLCKETGLVVKKVTDDTGTERTPTGAGGG